MRCVGHLVSWLDCGMDQFISHAPGRRSNVVSVVSQARASSSIFVTIMLAINTARSAIFGVGIAVPTIILIVAWTLDCLCRLSDSAQPAPSASAAEPWQHFRYFTICTSLFGNNHAAYLQAVYRRHRDGYQLWREGPRWSSRLISSLSSAALLTLVCKYNGNEVCNKIMQVWKGGRCKSNMPKLRRYPDANFLLEARTSRGFKRLFNKRRSKLLTFANHRVSWRNFLHLRLYVTGGEHVAATLGPCSKLCS